MEGVGVHIDHGVMDVTQHRDSRSHGSLIHRNAHVAHLGHPHFFSRIDGGRIRKNIASVIPIEVSSPDSHISRRRGIVEGCVTEGREVGPFGAFRHDDAHWHLAEQALSSEGRPHGLDKIVDLSAIHCAPFIRHRVIRFVQGRYADQSDAVGALQRRNIGRQIGREPRIIRDGTGYA